MKRVTSAPTLLRADDQSQLHYALPRRTTSLGASLMMFKSIVGAGLFALPYATRLIGIGGVTVAMLACGLLTFYCSMALVRVHDVVVADTLQRKLTIVFLAHHCFGVGASKMVYGLMVFTALGGLGAYLVLIGNALQSVYPALSSQAWAAIAAAFVAPFCLVKSTAFLSKTSIIGNIGVALVVAAVLAQGAIVTPGIREASFYGPAFRVETFPKAFGIVGFIWACAPASVIVERSMQKRSEFGAAYAATTVVVFVSATLFGIVCFLYFGADTCSIVVLNLGDGALAQTAKIAIALDLAFSYPLSMAPAREVVEKSLLSDSSPHLDAKRWALRIALIITTWCLCLFPQFGIILNIVGGLSVSVLCFILPPLMLLQVRRFHSTALKAQAHNEAEVRRTRTEATAELGSVREGVFVASVGAILSSPTATSESATPESGSAKSTPESTPTDSHTRELVVIDDSAAGRVKIVHAVVSADGAVVRGTASASHAGGEKVEAFGGKEAVAASVTSGIWTVGSGVDLAELTQGTESECHSDEHHPISFDPWRGFLRVPHLFDGLTLDATHKSLSYAGALSAAGGASPPSRQASQYSVGGHVGTEPSRKDVHIHGHTLHLANTHSALDVLSEARSDAQTPAPAADASVPVGDHKRRRPSHLSAYFAHVPHRSRHHKALKRLGLGTPFESAFLVAVALFGVSVLFFTTAASIQSITGTGVGTPEPAICV